MMPEKIIKMIIIAALLGLLCACGNFNDNAANVTPMNQNAEPEKTLPVKDYVAHKGKQQDWTSLTDDEINWWTGPWYGWTVYSSAEGDFAHLADTAQDIIGFIDTDGYNGSAEVWYYNQTTSETLAKVAGHFVRDQENRACFVSGFQQYSSDLKSNEQWIMLSDDPVAPDVPNLIVVHASYEDQSNPKNNYSYYVFLRPWGQSWEDVSGENRPASFPYTEMLPLHYDWYMEKVRLGLIPCSAEEGGLKPIAADIASWLTDEAARAGATGDVPAGTLKRVVPWLSIEADESTSYEDCASCFGVHGKKLTDENNISVFRWKESEEIYADVYFRMDNAKMCFLKFESYGVEFAVEG